MLRVTKAKKPSKNHGIVGLASERAAAHPRWTMKLVAICPTMFAIEAITT